MSAIPNSRRLRKPPTVNPQEPTKTVNSTGDISINPPLEKRVRWDLNPRSPAPKADTLIRARLRTLFHRLLLVYSAKGDTVEIFRLCIVITKFFASYSNEHRSSHRIFRILSELLLLMSEDPEPQLCRILDLRNIARQTVHKFEHKLKNCDLANTVQHLDFL
jgi:hypothetical protein